MPPGTGVPPVGLPETEGTPTPSLDWFLFALARPLGSFLPGNRGLFARIR